MRRYWVLLVVVGFGVLGRPGAAAELAGVAAGERAVIERLERVVTVDYRGVALEAVLADLRDRTGAEMVVRWGELEAAGVARDAPVELRLREVPAREVLRRALRYVDVGFEPIGYSIGGGLVTVSREVELGRRLVTRVYDARGLGLAVRSFEDVPRLDLDAALRGSAGDGGAGLGTAAEVRRLAEALKAFIRARGS
ncbi:MAG: hypothetical protein AAF823_00515 [Planctomycetota bacterium]